MRGFKLNFITILAFCLLLLYAYFAAMGVLYRTGCEIWKAGLFFLAVIAVISVCIYLMCKARATRWDKIGVPGQVILGVIIVAVFFYMGKPFSSYVSILGEKKQVYEAIENVKSAAQQVNNAYLQYVNQRVSNYAARQRVGLPGHSDGGQYKVSMLQNTISPSELTSVVAQRNMWLSSLNELRISNVQMPTNLKLLRSCVQKWTLDYEDLGSVILIDEVDVQPFATDAFASSLDALNSRLAGYSAWAFFVALLCSIFMLLPYFTTERWIGGPVNNRKDSNKVEYL